MLICADTFINYLYKDVEGSYKQWIPSWLRTQVGLNQGPSSAEGRWTREDPKYQVKGLYNMQALEQGFSTAAPTLGPGHSLLWGLCIVKMFSSLSSLFLLDAGSKYTPPTAVCDISKVPWEAKPHPG